MKDLCLESASVLLDKIRKGENSSVDICNNYIKRIEQFDKDVKAWAYFDKNFLIDNSFGFEDDAVDYL